MADGGGKGRSKKQEARSQKENLFRVYHNLLLLELCPRDRPAQLSRRRRDQANLIIRSGRSNNHPKPVAEREPAVRREIPSGRRRSAPSQSCHVRRAVCS